MQLSDKMNLKMREAFLKLRLSGMSSKQENSKRERQGKSLARMLLRSKTGNLMLAYHKLKSNLEQERQKKKCSNYLTNQMLFGQKRLLKQVLERLRAHRTKKQIEEKIDNIQQEFKEMDNSKIQRQTVLKFLRNYVNNLQRAFFKLRYFNRDQSVVQEREKSSYAMPINNIFHRMSAKRNQAFYKLLRCFGNGDSLYDEIRKKREKDKQKKALGFEGVLSEEAKNKFKDFLGKLVKKPKLRNSMLDRVEQYSRKRNKKGEFDDLLDKLKSGQIGNVEELLAYLAERAKNGDQHAADLLDKVNNGDKFRIKDLEKFMEDGNESGKYSQLLGFVGDTSDLKFSDLAGIITRNNKKKGFLNDLQDELDEQDEVQSILRYLKANNSDKAFDKLIDFIETENPKLNKLLNHISNSNLKGKYDSLVHHLDNKDKRLQDKLIEHLKNSNNSQNQENQEALRVLKQAESLGIAEIYSRLRDCYEKGKFGNYEKGNNQHHNRNLRGEGQGNEGELDRNSQAIETANMQDWAQVKNILNEGDDQEIDRIAQYLSHANKTTKGKYNKVVAFFNELSEQEGEDSSLLNLFDFLEKEYKVTAETIHLEGDPAYKDFYRVISNGDKLQRCLDYLKEANSTGNMDSLLEELNNKKVDRFSSFVKVLKQHTQQNPHLHELRDLLNCDLFKNELMSFVFLNNPNNCNKELIEFISSQEEEQGPIGYLDIITKVISLQKKGKCRNVLNFIDDKGKKDFLGKAMTAVRNFGAAGSIGQVLEQLRTLEKQGKLRKDQILNKLAECNQDNQMDKVLADLAGKSIEHNLMTIIENYIEKNPKNPAHAKLRTLLDNKLADKVRDQSNVALESQNESRVEPFLQLTDLIDVLNENEDLKRDCGVIETLLDQERKKSRFRDTLAFMKDNNLNGKYSPLIRRMEYKPKHRRRGPHQGTYFYQSCFSCSILELYYIPGRCPYSLIDIPH